MSIEIPDHSLFLGRKPGFVIVFTIAVKKTLSNGRLFLTSFCQQMFIFLFANIQERMHNIMIFRTLGVFVIWFFVRSIPFNASRIMNGLRFEKMKDRVIYK